MRKLLATCLIVFLCLVGAGTYAAFTITMSAGEGGRIFSITPTAQQFTFTEPVRIISVYNAGTTGQVVLALSNSTTTELDTASTNAIPIRGGNAGTWSKGGYSSVSLKAGGSYTCLVDIAVWH